MGNPFKVMTWGYLLPLGAGAMVLFIPEYDEHFLKWFVLIIGILLVMPVVLVFRFPKNKKKAYRLTLLYQLYAFTFFFTFPLLKILSDKLIFQILLILVFIGIYFLARFDQQTKSPLVFPDGEHKSMWITIPFYAIPPILGALGFGGDHIALRIAFDRHGSEFMMPYMAIILYLFACWLLFLFSSLAYKSHVKEGFLDK